MATSKSFMDKVERTPLTVVPATCDNQPEEWIDPVLFSSESVGPPIAAAEVLPAPFAAHVESIAEATQTPEGLGVAMLLAVLAAAVQRKVEISPGGSHIEPVSLWVCSALRSGTRKTAVVGALTGPILEWERDAAERLAPEIESAEIKTKLLVGRIDSLMKKAAKGPVTAIETAQKEIEKLKREIPRKVTTPQIFVDDTTVEALQNRMAENDERMAVISDEAGFFEVATGMYTGGKFTLDVYLKGHAGSPCRVIRSGRRVDLTRPALSFGLAIQPDMVARLGSSDKRQLRSNGFIARFLFLLPESNVGNRDVRANKRICPKSAEIYALNIKQLLSYQPDVDKHGNWIPIRLSVSSGALEIWHNFAQIIENRQKVDGDLSEIGDWSGKFPGAILRIAALCHVAEFGLGSAAPTEVNVTTMERAVKLGWKFLDHALTAFDLLGLDPVVADAKVVADWITKGKLSEFKKRDAHRQGRFTNGTAERVGKALDVLVDRGILKSRTIDTRKPTTVFYVNPKFLNSAAQSITHVEP